MTAREVFLSWRGALVLVLGVIAMTEMTAIMAAREKMSIQASKPAMTVISWKVSPEQGRVIEGIRHLTAHSHLFRVHQPL